MDINQDTIVARSTPAGKSAIAVIRLSGTQSFPIVNSLFPSRDLSAISGRNLEYGKLYHRDGSLLDEVVLACFKGPASYTGEDVIEISCHGSDYIVQKIIEALIESGARPAGPGEFTMRAFFNGKMDLTQAEGVIDLIESENRAQHQLALHQIRGGFSQKINQLREKLIHFASMIELELDFGEEDVEFAQRDELRKLVLEVQEFIQSLLDSFSMGNAIKKGIPTVIAGRPNAGKSTLLNALLQEERAIVSDIEGTTRDTIEEVINIEGLPFRIIDTAGLRDAGDKIEEIGIQRTMEKIAQSAILIYIFDLNRLSAEEVRADIEKIDLPRVNLVLVANKSDLSGGFDASAYKVLLDRGDKFIAISALVQEGIEELKTLLVNAFGKLDLSADNSVLHNSRHYNALFKTNQSLENIILGMDSHVPSDLIAMDIRHAMNSLAEILGKGISPDDLLENIFSRFCIGK